jgi:uncharacterized membrane protein
LSDVGQFLTRLRYKGLRLLALVVLVIFVATLRAHGGQWRAVNLLAFMIYVGLMIFLFLKDRAARNP